MVLIPNNKHQTVGDILKSKPRTLSAEIIPPRNGAEIEKILEQIEVLADVPVDFISVTKGAGGSLRGGTLPIAQVIKSRFGICSLAHFTCRDYNNEEIENALMDHHYFGVHDILALRGDPPDGKVDHFKPAPNRHSYAWQLCSQINQLNSGQYLVREGFDDKTATGVRSGTKTNFCIGVAAHPEHEPFEESIAFLKKKVEMGAQYAITQMIFSSETYKKFLDACRSAGIFIPIIPGVRILNQLQSAVSMAQRFGCKVPQHMLDLLGKAKSKEDGRQIGLEMTTRFCRELLAAGAPGIHVFVMNDPVASASLLKNLK